ncbi:MAG: flavodoxin [Ruminococcus flavefaciens]|nr:flavodoxin [Ruminococcus flavefaciens]
MNIAIRYYTRSGHTEKLANAIAKKINVEAENVSVPLAGRTDLLFLGCSYYAFDMAKEVKDFIAENKDNIGEIVCFGTSAMMKSMKKPMKKLTDAYGIRLSDEEFHCRGEFKFTNKGRPNAEDLQKAAIFAERVAKTNER